MRAVLFGRANGNDEPGVLFDVFVHLVGGQKLEQ